MSQTRGSEDAAATVPLPYGETAFRPVRALERWLAAAATADGPVFRRIWIPARRDDGPPRPPRLGTAALTAQSVALIVQTSATAPGFERRDIGVHGLKRGAPTKGTEKRAHPARLKRLGRHKSYGPLGGYLGLGDLFADHPLDGVLQGWLIFLLSEGLSQLKEFDTRGGQRSARRSSSNSRHLPKQ